MTVLESNISWCTGTLNLTVGCSSCSAGCNTCYARTLVNGRMRGDFDGTMVFHEKRLADIRKFKPALNPSTGLVEPKMIFVNSLSDFWHEKIPDDFIHRCLDRFEQHDDTIFQILTKRPVRARKILSARYGNRGIPRHFWIGTSVEDNQVAARMNVMRRLKDQVGEFTLFVSVEPLIGPVDDVDFTGADWVLIGGESGKGARECREEWFAQAFDGARAFGAAVHGKQWGKPENNPYARQIKAEKPELGIVQAFKWAVQMGLELAPEEKGGATFRGKLWHEKPKAFAELVAKLNQEAPAEPVLPL